MAAPQVLSTPELLSIILKHMHHEDRSRRARRNPPGDVSLAPFYMYQDRLTPFLARAMLVDSIWFEVAADILWKNAEINDRWKFISPIRQQIYASRITHLRFSPGATDSSIAAHVVFLRLVSLDFGDIRFSARWEILDRYLRPEIRTVTARVLDGMSSHAFLDKLIERCPHLRVLGLHDIRAEDPAPELVLSLSQLVDLHTIHLIHEMTDYVNPPLMSALLGLDNLKQVFLGPGRLPCHNFYDEMKLKTLPRGLRSLRLTGGSFIFMASLLISSDLVHLEGRIMDHGTNLFARLINMSSIQYLDLRWEHGTNIRARILRSLHQLSNLSWLLLDGPYGPEPKLPSRDLRENDYVYIFSGLRKLRKVHLGIDSNVVFHSFVSLSESCPELTDFRIQGKCDFDDLVSNPAVPLFPYLNSKPAELANSSPAGASTAHVSVSSSASCCGDSGP